MFLLQNQTLVFLSSCIVGFLLGMIYDVFRISRLAFKFNAVIIFIEDILFFAIAAVSSFAFVLLGNDGVLRGFLIVGEIVGAILYFSTLSLLIMKTAHFLINVVKSILKFIYKLLIYPIIRFIKWIIRLIKKIIHKVKLKVKESKIEAETEEYQQSDSTV